MQSYRALSAYKPDSADGAVYYMNEIESDWSYDLKDTGKNFWYDCCLCNQQMKISKNGRLNAALCEKCWVFLQGYYWFAPTCYKARPDPCVIHSNQ